MRIILEIADLETAVAEFGQQGVPRSTTVFRMARIYEALSEIAAMDHINGLVKIDDLKGIAELKNKYGDRLRYEATEANKTIANIPQTLGGLRE